MSRSFLFLFVAIFLFSKKNEHVSYEMIPPDRESSFGTEDPSGRIEYERLLTSNPDNGLVPFNIRKKELAYSRRIDDQTIQLRKQGLAIRSVGPGNVGGRTRAVALDIRNENVILAGGVSGGIWKSTDGGLTWTRKSSPGNRNSVTCIVQDTRSGKEDTWYHGTGEFVGNSARGGGAPFRGDGIYKSTNNGESWRIISSTSDSDPSVFNSQFQYIWDIEINHLNLVEDEVVVAAFGGILKSVNGGESWRVLIGSPLFNLSSDVDLNEVNASRYTGLGKTVDGIFFASLSAFNGEETGSPDAGIYASRNTDVWYPITPEVIQFSDYRRIVVGNSARKPNESYFVIDGDSDYLLKYTLTRFTSNGPVGTWSRPLALPSFEAELGSFETQNSYNMVVKVDPSNPSTVFFGRKKSVSVDGRFSNTGKH